VLASPRVWWLALVLGVLLRAYLLLFTPGTFDVAVWQSHAGWIWEHGLVGYYGRSEVFNHPPFIGAVMEQLWRLARAAPGDFAFWLRAPFAVLDLGSALLLLSLFRESAWRYAVAAAYWLHPLAVLYSAYHGNTDSAVAFFMLLGVWAASRGSAAWAGAALGVGLWVKLPAALAVPALFLALPDLRARARFSAALGVVGVSTYLPVLLAAPGLLAERVFLYPGLYITNADGDPIWGLWSILGAPEALPGFLQGPAALHRRFNSAICWAGVLLLAWLRRDRTAPHDLARTVCASLLLFYALTWNWAFQYLAWVVPFLFFLEWRWAALATLLLGGYVYGSYAFLTGSPVLLGPWDFAGTRGWPGWLIALRSASVLFCAAAAGIFLVEASRREWRVRRT
jgi:hypothetical protein